MNSQGQVLGDPVVIRIAKAAGVHPAQVVLRWHLDSGRSAIPKSVTPARIALGRSEIALYDVNWLGSEFDGALPVQVRVRSSQALRLATVERAIESELVLGRHDSLTGELAALVAADLVLAHAGGRWMVLAGATLWGLHMGLTQGLLSALVAGSAPAATCPSNTGTFWASR